MFIFERFLKNVLFLPCIILEIFAILQTDFSNFQIPNNFHTKLWIAYKKIELLIIFLEKWYKHEIITSYFSSQEKITDAIIQNDGELIGIFFQMVSWCTTIAPNFLFLVYHYPELWTSYKNDPAQAYAYPSWSRINRFKWF